MKYYKAKLNNLDHYEDRIKGKIDFIIGLEIIITDTPKALLEKLSKDYYIYYIPEIGHLCKKEDFEYIEEIKVTNEFLLERMENKFDELIKEQCDECTYKKNDKKTIEMMKELKVKLKMSDIDLYNMCHTKCPI